MVQSVPVAEHGKEFTYGPSARDRRPRRVLVVGLSLLVLWPTALLLVAGEWSLAVAIGLFFGAPVLLAARRLPRLALRTDGDHFVVVNLLRTHRLHRDDIRAFRIFPDNPRRVQYLVILRSNRDSLECDVTRPFRTQWRSETKSDLRACKAELDSWLNAAG